MFTPARRLALLLLFAVTALAAPIAMAPTTAQAALSDPPMYAAIVVDATTGEVLYARSADSHRYPASITKVMTMYLVFEQLAEGKLKPDDRIVISPRAAAQEPTKLGLAAGESVSVDDAIRALAVQSANDIAVAVAEKVGGTEAAFAAMMTLKANELGMTQTRFVNAHGLPNPRQLSSARDIAILSRAVMRDFPQYYPYFSQNYWTFRGRQLRNHNGLMREMPGIDGLKTGFTRASGFNLAASGVRDGRRLIVVVLGGRSVATRNAHVAQLLNTGFDVMRRRDRGEIITVAQSMFEPQIPTAPVAYASNDRPAPPSAPAAVRPRDYTADLNAGALRGTPAPSRGGMRPVENPPEPTQAVVLASMAPPTAEASKPAPTRVAPARPKPTPAAKPKRDPNAIWVAQVGSFKARSDANAWLKEVGRRFKAQFTKAEGEIISASGRFRVRYVGMTEAAAKKACEALKARRLDCMVVRGK